MWRRHSRERVLKPLAPAAIEAPVVGAAQPPSPSTFAATLAHIFTDACEHDPELNEKLEALQPSHAPVVETVGRQGRRGTGFEGRRGTGFEGRRLTAFAFEAPTTEATEAQARKKKDAGELRSTDVRVYGTLDNLLTNGWKPPTPPTPDFSTDLIELPFLSSESRPGSTAVGSRPATEGNGKRGSSSKRFSKIRAAGVSVAGKRGSVLDRQQSRNSIQGRKSVGTLGRGSLRRASTAGSQTAREKNRRSVHRGLSRESLSSGFTEDSSEAWSESEGSQNAADRELLDELKENPMSNDWSMLLSVAQDKKEERDSYTGGRVRAFEDEAEAWEHHPSMVVPHFAEVSLDTRGVTIITKPTEKSWNVKRGPRPRSPLRPGVYVGHQAPEHAKLTHLGKLRMLPDGAAAEFKSGRFPGIKNASRPVTVDPMAKDETDDAHVANVSVWHQMLARLEDDGKTEDSRAYDAWRKRVVECTRTMQMEAERFRLDEQRWQ